ncbi:rod shape-determining protein RodA [Patescibacteria group bacterium]|nr:rod shape-determining protein RodA [Patescibacteria group bacterium]MBU1721200.1 rod shape-determining protein RodA [Patescibacteria group bacterium]MBU1901092.1 rod shape-determining protein RodA [Patescibacteria group bacterium]
MIRLRTIIFGYDWFLAIVVFILTAIGIAAIYSIDLSRGETLIYFPTQVIASALGLGIMGISGVIHKTRYASSARVLYMVGLLLLMGVLLFGTSIRGTRGWFRIAGFSFQPAEFAKVALVLLLGWWMSKQGRRFDKWEYVLSSGLAAGFYVGLIMLQPDLGSASVLLGVWFLLLLVSRVKKRYIFGFIGIGLVVVIFAWFFLFKTYQKERVLNFVDPGRDPLGDGYNVTQSLIAVGSGQWWGRGLGSGSQSQLHFLPEAQTDFIVAVIGEELGFVGIILLLGMYYLLMWRLVVIARDSNDDFSAYTVMGVLFVFGIQMVVNIGGATGLLPVTGVTLPFVSYGGSSLIMNYFLIGIAMAIYRSNQGKEC